MKASHLHIVFHHENWQMLKRKYSFVPQLCCRVVVAATAAASVVVVVATPKSAAQRAGSVASRRHEVDV